MATTALNTTETSIDRAAGSAAIMRPSSVFDSVADLKIYRDRWQQRCAYYQVLRAYYKGTVYSDYPELVKALKLYAGIRQIFGPLRRAVRMDVAKVPGGWKLPENTPQQLQEAVQQVRAWSHFEATYSLAVQRGAVAGEFGLLVVDDWTQRTVEIIALRPDEVVIGKLADGTPFGLVVKCGLVDRAGVYEYAQLITPDSYTTYRNGELHDYDGAGSKRRNLLGFVPLQLSPYIAGEDGIGENAFAGANELLDRVNDAASQALDVIQRNAEPLTVFSGVDAINFDPENNAVTMPKTDSKAYTLAPKLVISEALALIDKVLVEFKNVLPQLIIDQLASHNDLAYDTVVTLCMELIDHVKDVRTHVDAAIAQAERWALMAGLQMGLFVGIDPLQHTIDPERPVIEPGPNAKLMLESAQTGLQSAQAALQASQEGPRTNRPQQSNRTPQDGDEE